MSTFEINIFRGVIEVKGAVIAPLDIDGTRVGCVKMKLPIVEHDAKNGWKKIMANISINNEIFGMNMNFFNGKLQSIWFSWLGGKVGKKGYNASERDLIEDKNKLSKLMAKSILGKNPDLKDYNKDVYYFDWGYISISASIQSNIVVMGMVWE